MDENALWLFLHQKLSCQLKFIFSPESYCKNVFNTCTENAFGAYCVYHDICPKSKSNHYSVNLPFITVKLKNEIRTCTYILSSVAGSSSSNEANIFTLKSRVKCSRFNKIVYS